MFEDLDSDLLEESSGDVSEQAQAAVDATKPDTVVEPPDSTQSQPTEAREPSAGGNDGETEASQNESSAQAATVKQTAEQRRARHNSASYMAHNLDELSNLIGNLKESAHEVDRLESENQRLRDQLEQKSRQMTAAANDKAQAQVVTLQEQLESARNDVQSAQKETGDARAELEQLKGQLEGLQQRLSDVEKSAKSRDEMMKETAETLSKLASQLLEKS